jgi:hypothetical protein
VYREGLIVLPIEEYYIREADMEKLFEKIESRSELNPLIWDKNNNLHEDVEKKLFDIVQHFVDYCDIKLEVADVQIVGSNASFNYTDKSDLDVHLMINFDLMKGPTDLLQLYFNKEKADFNKAYKVFIHGIKVEIYVQDIKSSTMSNGVYSLYKHKWIKFPKPIDIPTYNFNDIITKWLDKEKKVLKSGNSTKIKSMINSLYMIRTNSLQADGEFGKGNLLFKELRNLGVLDELKNALIDAESNELSLESLNENFLIEASRNDLLTKSKVSTKGRERFKRRVKSKVANQVKQFNSIDMNKLFKDDILTVNVAVKGETDDYTVKISFGGFLKILRKEIDRIGMFDLRAVTRALIEGFNKDDVYIHCSCPDWKYRFAYWGTKNNINSGEPQNSNGMWIRNPDDRLGSGCKHVLLVLSNNSWLIKVASVIKNYVKYMEKYYQKQYADIIYPAIYGKPYEEPVQTGMFDTEDELDSEKDTLDKSNEFGRTSTQFKKGNKQGLRFASKDSEIEGQEEIDLD